jgi:DNA mismatch endonuclease (patch repair protein)
MRYRLHVGKLPGKPDLVLPRFRAAIFVHGCFWHRHANCRYASTPATRAEFWQAKFSANVARDFKCRDLLLDLGWRVAVVWECSLRRNDDTAIDTICDWLKGEDALLEI